MTRRTQEFETIHSEGGLLPPDLLRKIIGTNEKLPGKEPRDYHIPQGNRLNESITHSWNRLRSHWTEFREAAKDLNEGEAATGLTNDKWNIPLLRELGFGILPTVPGPEIDGRSYAINRFYGATPIHLVGCGVNLDRRSAGVRGAAAVNPHGLVQEFLNRSEGHLWAILSNGFRFRILRDNQALSRQSYLEFDLYSMFSGEVYSDFVLFWLLAHATRFSPREEGNTASTFLEDWTAIAAEEGTRALESLRGGVEKALQTLGQGLVGHRRNSALRDALRSEALSLKTLHEQLLRIVYRMIFLFVAEDRSLDGVSLLHPPDDSEEGREKRARYAAHYSMARLRHLAGQINGSRHGDLWQQFNLVVGALSGNEAFAHAREELALPALGSDLWSPKSTDRLNAASLTGGAGVELANVDFLDTIRHLAFTHQNKNLQPVDYKNLGSEEFGGVYESFLSLTPQISGDNKLFSFKEFAGNERKTSGSYYTPSSLVQALLDSALDPVVEETLKKKKGKDAEKALLALKVCDPSCGSGHFLVGAAHRLARHLARVRAHGAGESEPSPAIYQHALRDVITHCLYGVDINPMAVELCKVTLWLEALEPGKPLSFLDHHIQWGNSLFGTTPALLAQGIPDEAFTAIEGDDKIYCQKYKKQNKDERETGQMYLEQAMPWERLGNLATALYDMDTIRDDTLEGVQQKEARYAELVGSDSYRSARLLADAWCAAFVWKKEKDEALPFPITQDILRRIEGNPHWTPKWMEREIQDLAEYYQFFHWHLAFPTVFQPLPQSEVARHDKGAQKDDPQGWTGGFDVVLGNPPWERVKIQEKEWFAERKPEIASAANAAARKAMIKKLKTEQPQLYQDFKKDLRKAEGESHFLRNSGRYPLCGRGDINLYPIFAEANRSLLQPQGSVGCILPTGISTDATTQIFFQELIESRSLISLFDFENRMNIFPGVHRSMKFCLFTVGSPSTQRLTQEIEFTFFAHTTEDLRDPERRFTLSPEEITLLNPNTRTCPTFRTRADAELNKAIYRRIPILIREKQDNKPETNLWGIKFGTMFHMANDSGLFHTRDQLEEQGGHLKGNIFSTPAKNYLPLYEAKLLHHYDHRFASYKDDSGQGKKTETYNITEAEKDDPHAVILPRYWLAEEHITAKLRRKVDVGNTRAENAGKELFDTTLRSTAIRDSLNSHDANSIIQAEQQEKLDLTKEWMLGLRRITHATNQRTVIASLLPAVGFGDSGIVVSMRWLPSVQWSKKTILPDEIPSQEAAAALLMGAILNSVVLDFCVRNAVGSTQLSHFYIKQFPILSPTDFLTDVFTGTSAAAFIIPRALELSYTAWDMKGLAHDCGYFGPPFRWEEERRFLLRCELDALFFHLYLPSDGEGAWLPTAKETDQELAQLKESFPTPRHGVDYILDTFPIIKEQEEKAQGYYRSKEMILQRYDAMQQARAAGAPYESPLDPLPGPPVDEQGHYSSFYHWDREQWPVHIHPVHPEWEPSLVEAWFRIWRKEWAVLHDEQLFPWDGREAFIYGLIPYLVQGRPGDKFEFYRDAAFLASRPELCEALLPADTLRAAYCQGMDHVEALYFPDTQSIRPRLIRETLQNKDLIRTDGHSGATTVVDPDRLPPLAPELMALLPLILEAGDNLDRALRRGLEAGADERVMAAAARFEEAYKKTAVR
ncbi:MAG: N-6 DNA methylase [Candidatus Hydrogenedentales bacterium]